MGNSPWSQNPMKLFGKIILALIFLTAGIPKILDPESFRGSVESFHLAPLWALPWIVTTIPYLEVLSAISLLWEKTEGGACIIILLLCLGFVVFYVAAISQGISPDCGCFGKNPLLQAKPITGLLRATILVFLTLGVWGKSLQIRCEKEKTTLNKVF